MWDTWLNGSTLPALEQTAAFSQKRHMLLAGNIANLDVPGYKTRDVSVTDFHQSLRSAIAQQNATDEATHSHGETAMPDPMQQVRDVSDQVLYHDGSDVSLEQQVTEMAKNNGLHNTAITLMRSQFRTLQVAIQESAAV